MIAPVSALFVRPDGPYPSLVEDWWDEARDARSYSGPRPVVAHPPCARWGNLWWSARHKGLGVGDDEGCFEAAIAAVRRWGGVLEHPESSRAWPRFGIQRPEPGAWTRSIFRPDEWVAVVDQWCWGHRARKRTWLVAVGASRLPHPTLMPPGSERAYCASGPGVSRTAESRKTHAIELMGRREREFTPPAFAELLIGIAVSVKESA